MNDPTPTGRTSGPGQISPSEPDLTRDARRTDRVPGSRTLRNPVPRGPVEAATGDPAGPHPTPGRFPRSGPPRNPTVAPTRPFDELLARSSLGDPGAVAAAREAPADHVALLVDQALAGIDQDEDWELVRRAQAGDTQAFGRIYDRYFDTVYGYISYRTGSRTLAEDLTSEVWLRVLRRIGSVRWQRHDLSGWLVTIARNLIADHQKSGRQRLEVTTAHMLDDDLALGPEGHQQDEVRTRLDTATLLDAVRRLPPEQQECITLRFLQGRSIADTAQIMGKNEGAIKALQYRAVRNLGRLLPEGLTP